MATRMQDAGGEVEKESSEGALRKGPEAGGLMTRNMRTAGDPQLKGEGDLHPKNSFCTPSTLSSPTSCLRSRIYPPWCC